MTLTRTSISVACALLLASGAQAGDLSAPAAPTEPGSAMFTLQDHQFAERMQARIDPTRPLREVPKRQFS